METARPKPPMKKHTFNHGGKNLEVPLLSAPVGRPSAALSTMYPKLNQPADLAIVDYYLSRFEALKFIVGTSTNEMGVARLLGAVNAVARWDDRNSAPLPRCRLALV